MIQKIFSPTVSVTLLFSMTGTFLGGVLADWLGRRRAILASNVGIAVAWVGTAFAHNFGVLIISRAVMGLGLGMNFTVSFCYLSEISVIRLRGAFGAVNVMAINMAFVVGFILGGNVQHIWIIIVGK